MVVTASVVGGAVVVANSVLPVEVDDAAVVSDDSSEPPQAAVATWRPAWCFGSGNLEISSGDYHWALGLLQMCAKFLT